MPNGHTGSFVIKATDLKQLVQAVSGDAMVGKLTTGSRLEAACAADIARLLEECSRDRIGVEEQDSAFYVIHISNEPIIWIVVKSESPIFMELRSRHERWVADHPG